MYDDVLLPVALAEVDENPAIDHALDVAETYDATLHVISVVDPTIYDPLTPETGRVHEELESAATETLDEVEKRANSRGVEVETRVGHGSPSTVITDYADSRGIDMVVLATHGRTGLEHALLGSVTEKVVRTCDAPVMTVPLPT